MNGPAAYGMDMLGRVDSLNVTPHDAAV